MNECRLNKNDASIVIQVSMFLFFFLICTSLLVENVLLEYASHEILFILDSTPLSKQTSSFCLNEPNCLILPIFILCGVCSSVWQVDVEAGLQITAGQQTMSGLIADLTGQTPVLPVILTGHFWIETLYFPYICRLMFYTRF